MRRFPLQLIVWGLLPLFFSACTSYSRNAEGLRYYGQARYTEAINSFQTALQAEPMNQDTYYNLAATYHQMGRTALHSTNPAYAQQQYDMAEQNYKYCLERDPNHTAAYRGLAVLYMERQQPNPAFQLLENWSKQNTAAPEPCIELARLYQEFAQYYVIQGRLEDAKGCQELAVEKLQEALGRDPNNFRALRALGYVREQGGDIQGALSDYRRSLESNRSQKDLEQRISILSQGGVPPATTFPGASTYPGATSNIASGTGATVYNGGSTTRVGSTLSRSPF